MTEATTIDESRLEDDTRYLLFHLGEELYGTPLLDVREVVEPQVPKPVPNTIKAFVGVINIRGEIVGVIDLRMRFGQVSQKSAESALMVFDTPNGPMAALVDKVDAVIKIPEVNIERKPNVRTKVPASFLLGIAKETERMVTLIDLNRILGAEDLRASKSS